MPKPQHPHHNDSSNTPFGGDESTSPQNNKHGDKKTKWQSSEDDQIGFDEATDVPTDEPDTEDGVPLEDGDSMVFEIDGDPKPTILVKEMSDGSLQFTVVLDPESENTGDLRGLFFDVADESLVDGLAVDGEHVTDEACDANGVSGLGNGTSMNGAGRGSYDVGVEIGTQGMSGDDIQTTTFTLSHDTEALTLDLISGQTFGVRLTSVGPGGEEGREDSLKLVGTASELVPNTAPEAHEDSFTADEDNVVSGNVLADNGNGADVDEDGDPMIVVPTPVEGPANGTLELNPDGSFTYEPNADFYGTDTFTYEVSDDKGDTSTATVTMEIQPVNDNPVAMDDQMRLMQTEEAGLVGSLDVIANDTDVDNANEELFVTAINGVDVAPGEAVYIGNEVYVFLEADGRTLSYSDVDYEEPASFDYTMADGAGGFDTATVELGLYFDDPLV